LAARAFEVAKQGVGMLVDCSSTSVACVSFALKAVNILAETMCDFLVARRSAQRHIASIWDDLLLSWHLWRGMK